MRCLKGCLETWILKTFELEFLVRTATKWNDMLDIAWISSQLGDALAVGPRCWAAQLVTDLSVNRSFTLFLVMPSIRASMVQGWDSLIIGRVFVGENVARKWGFSMDA
ncbi:hypothetical protein Tco_1557938 [Tanacetum coccineum]